MRLADAEKYKKEVQSAKNAKKRQQSELK